MINRKPSLLNSDLHVGITLHRKNPLEERRAKALVLWFIHRGSAPLSPLQMKLSGILAFSNAPLTSTYPPGTDKAP